jgi:hypothetical protein
MQTVDRHINVKPLSPEEQKAYDKRYERVCAIWLARHQRDVAAELLPFLYDEVPLLRLRVVAALGKLESAVAEQPLQEALVAVLRHNVARLEAKLKTLETNKKSDIPDRGIDTSAVETSLRREIETAREKLAEFEPAESAPPIKNAELLRELPEFTLRLALARIRSRNLKGQAKIDALCAGMGTTWQEVRQFSVKIYGPKSSGYELQSPQGVMVSVIVDVLYHMGKKGENIEPFEQALTLSNAQRTKLKAATVSTEEEIKLILDYVAQVKINKEEDHALAVSHLLGLGKQIETPLFERLTYLRTHLPENQIETVHGKRIGAGYISLFRAARNTGNPRFVPLLQAFEREYINSFDPQVAHQAYLALKKFKEGRYVLDFPS